MYFSHVTRKCNKASSLHLVCTVFIILRVLSFFNSKLNMLWFNFIVGIYKAGFIFLCFLIWWSVRWYKIMSLKRRKRKFFSQRIKLNPTLSALGFWIWQFVLLKLLFIQKHSRNIQTKTMNVDMKNMLAPSCKKSIEFKRRQARKPFMQWSRISPHLVLRKTTQSRGWNSHLSVFCQHVLIHFSTVQYQSCKLYFEMLCSILIMN